MKKISRIALALFAAAGLAFGISSCDSKATSEGSNNAANDSTATEDVLRETALSKYVRYVDMIRIQTEYTLFQEYAKADSTAQYKMAVEANQHQARLQKRAEEIQNKYQQGLYLSQQSLESDQADLQKRQETASRQLDNMQIEYGRQLSMMQSQINDSIENVVKYICDKYHYDAILNSAAGLYFNPALDITDELIEELNKRYNAKK